MSARRFDLLDLGPFRYDTAGDIDAWINHLAGIEDQLRLLHAGPGMLTIGEMPECLFRRTGGIVGLLERLIEDGCTEAIDTGVERLTTAVLDAVAIGRPRPRGRREPGGSRPAQDTQESTAAQHRLRRPRHLRNRRPS